MPDSEKRGRDTRFKPGVSGNPKGRPRKPSPEKQTQDMLARVLNEVVAHRDGKPVTALEAMALKTRKRVLEEGKVGDFTRFIAVCQQFGLAQPPKDAEKEPQTGVLLVARPPKNDEEWERIYGEAARGMTGSPNAGESS